MLVNAQGKITVVPFTLPAKKQEQLLTPLREVLEPKSNKCGSLFHIGTRTHLK